MFYDREKCPIGDVMLEVKDLQLTKDSPKINFTVHKGEIVASLAWSAPAAPR